MPVSDWRHRARQVFSLSLLLGGMLACLLAYAVQIARGGENYKTADWLINYSGGFVRRGLFGELLLGLHLSAHSTLWLLFCLQSACYLLVVWYFVSFLKRQRYSWWSIALVCNPAALMFAVYDFGGSYRKELLVFVALILLAVVPRARPQASWRAPVLVVGSLLVYGLAVYSWEPAAFALPMVVYMLWRIRADTSAAHEHAVAAIVLATVLAVSGLTLSIIAHGGEAQVAAISAGLRARGFGGSNLFAGAIGALAWTSSESLSGVAANFPLYLVYLPLLALSALPLVAGEWLLRNRYWALAFGAATLPMFVTAVDYGRWIHVLVMGLTICTMTAGASGARLRWTAPWTVAFATLWGVPHIMTPHWIWRAFVRTLYEVVVRMVHGL